MNHTWGILDLRIHVGHLQSQILHACQSFPFAVMQTRTDIETAFSSQAWQTFSINSDKGMSTSHRQVEGSFINTLQLFLCELQTGFELKQKGEG